MFLLTTGELPIGAGKRALVAFVRGGGGLIGFHSATDTFHHWAAYKEMIGAEFSHHTHPSTPPVIVTDHSNPATHALGHRLQVDGRQRLDLLLRQVDADLLIPAGHRTDRNRDLLAAP